MGQNEVFSKIFSYFNHEREIIIENDLKAYLRFLNKENLFQHLSYILKEMIGNANKANLKRIHFIFKDMDISNIKEYEEGIKTFKEDLLLFYDKYIKATEKLGFYVKVDIFTNQKDLVLSVMNNTRILPIEKKRIDNNFERVINFNSIEEALNEGIDTSEGAGLGLILTLMLLKKLGLNQNVLKYTEDENSTKIEMKIPLSLLDKKEVEFIANIVKKEIDEIPQFPQHIYELQKILSNPNSNFSDLAQIINNDPALIADLLKVANSSLYMLPKKVKTIQEAVSQIGFKGVKSLVLAYSARKVLQNRYNKEIIEEAMQHSAEVAFFAYEIAKRYRFKDITDEIYTAAMLHDFGKIIINSLKPDVFTKITALCNEKGINTDIIENLTDGFNHSVIGSRLSEKWNFPDSIIEAIRFHHLPMEASEKNKNLVHVIYLANIIYYFQRKEYYFNNIDYQVLKNLNLINQVDFEDLVLSISDLFQERKLDR